MDVNSTETHTKHMSVNHSGGTALIRDCGKEKGPAAGRMDDLRGETKPATEKLETVLEGATVHLE